MNATGILLSTAVSFLFLFLLFRPLELFFPAKKKQKFLRPRFLDRPLFLFRSIPPLERPRLCGNSVGRRMADAMDPGSVSRKCAHSAALAANY